MRLDFDDFSLEGDVEEIIMVLKAMEYVDVDYPIGEELVREFPTGATAGILTEEQTRAILEPYSDQTELPFSDSQEIERDVPDD